METLKVHIAPDSKAAQIFKSFEEEKAVKMVKLRERMERRRASKQA